MFLTSLTEGEHRMKFVRVVLGKFVIVGKYLYVFPAISFEYIHRAGEVLLSSCQVVLPKEQTDATYPVLTKIDYVFCNLRYTSGKTHLFKLQTLTEMCIG